jgi:hypothetical protein
LVKNITCLPTAWLRLACFPTGIRWVWPVACPLIILPFDYLQLRHQTMPRTWTNTRGETMVSSYRPKNQNPVDDSIREIMSKLLSFPENVGVEISGAARNTFGRCFVQRVEALGGNCECKHEPSE